MMVSDDPLQYKRAAPDFLLCRTFVTQKMNNSNVSPFILGIIHLAWVHTSAIAHVAFDDHLHGLFDCFAAVS